MQGIIGLEIEKKMFESKLLERLRKKYGDEILGIECCPPPAQNAFNSEDDNFIVFRVELRPGGCYAEDHNLDPTAESACLTVKDLADDIYYAFNLFPKCARLMGAEKPSVLIFRRASDLEMEVVIPVGPEASAVNAAKHIVGFAAGQRSYDVFLDTVVVSHRTEQLCFTKLCLKWLYRLAGLSPDDLRRKASVEVARKVVAALGENGSNLLDI